MTRFTAEEAFQAGEEGKPITITFEDATRICKSHGCSVWQFIEERNDESYGLAMQLYCCAGLVIRLGLVPTLQRTRIKANHEPRNSNPNRDSHYGI